MRLTQEIKTIIVLCGHHSGSSMIAGALHRMGVEMEGEESHKEIGGIHPRGMWERKEFEVMNDRILSLAGGSWHHPPPHEKILALMGNTALNLEIKRLVEKTQKPLWGWKDPRNALTIPVWHPHLVNPYYVVTTRGFKSTMASYMAERHRWKFGKNFKTQTQVLNHILDYQHRVLDFARDKENVFMTWYEKILGNPQAELDKLTNFIGGIQVNDAALEMIDPTLRHF